MDRYTVEIKRVSWIDRDGLEAEVLFEIKDQNFWAFCHPCNFNDGETADVYFSFIEVEISEHAFWNENREFRQEIISIEDNKYYYKCFGQLQNIHPVIIDCGTLILTFGDWLDDEKVIGNYVYFVMSRLDIVRA